MSNEASPLPSSNNPATAVGANNLEISALADQALAQLERSDNREVRLRKTVAGLFLAGGAVAAWGVGSGEASHLKFDKPMPYIETLQRDINNIDNILEGVGIAAFIGGLTGIAALKLGAQKDTRLQVIDQWSSRNMSEDRLNPNRSVAKRTLEATFAGRIPVMTCIGAGLAVFAGAIGGEVGNGPQRPIEKALATFAPGETMVVNYAGAMPMVESYVPRSIADSIIATAAKRGIKANIMDEDLGILSKGQQNLSDLSIGVQMPLNSPLSWGVKDGCYNVPVAVDKSAGMKLGETIRLNGVSAVVRQQLEGISATNRVGVVMEQEAMAACLRGGVEAPVHSVVVDAAPSVVQEIVDTANPTRFNVAVITKNQYLDNSKKFWESNVKPITSVLALFAGVFASAVAGSRMRESLVRDRREWAAKLVNGNSQAMIRATEFTRVIKDGVLASIIGGGIAAFATPVVVNTLESGFQATVGLKEFAVGSAIAIAGSIAGAFKSLINPKKIIRPEESLRS
ncbi:MAG: hypothetical protein QFB87_01945 [Patescibacteria group bacterium]|nr:hypothetical protein [Patescibacteria group bacterium]